MIRSRHRSRRHELVLTVTGVDRGFVEEAGKTFGAAVPYAEATGDAALEAKKMVHHLPVDASLETNPNAGDESTAAKRGTDMIASARMLCPAISCNPGEIVELHLTKDDMVHLPKHAVPISLAEHDNISRGDTLQSEHKDEFEVKEAKSKQLVSDTAHVQTSKDEDKHSGMASHDEAEKAADPVDVAPIDLALYASAEKLESLGLDRLKGELMSLGLKCGGSLQERAGRLFAVKGLKPEEYPRKLRSRTKGRP